MDHLFAERSMRPARPGPRRWGRLHPVAGKAWVDLLPPDAPDGLCVLYGMLDGGLVEAWQDDVGHVRLRWPS